MPQDEIRFRRRIEDKGFSILYHALTMDKELSDAAFRLYSLLLKYAQQKGYAYPGIARLAENLGKSEPTIERNLRELRKRGLISRQRRFGTSTITWIEDPNEVYGNLEQMCEPIKDNGSDDDEPIKNDGIAHSESIKNDGSNPSKTMAKEEEEKNNKSGEEEEKEPVHLSESEEKEASIWQTVLGELKLQMTKAAFDTWVKDTRPISQENGVLIVGAQNEFARDWLESRLRTTVERTLVGIVGHPVEVRFVVTQGGT